MYFVTRVNQSSKLYCKLCTAICAIHCIATTTTQKLSPQTFCYCILQLQKNERLVYNAAERPSIRFPKTILLFGSQMKELLVLSTWIHNNYTVDLLAFSCSYKYCYMGSNFFLTDQCDYTSYYRGLCQLLHWKQLHRRVSSCI